MAHVAGEKVGRGFYWSPLSGEHVDVREGEQRTLPGEDGAKYYKVHPVVMLLCAPVIGLMFVMFMPVIGVVMTLDALASRLFGHATKAVAAVATPGALVGQAALTTKRDERKVDEDADEKQLSEEIARRRSRGEK